MRNNFCQEIFNKCYKHLLTQNEKCIDVDDRCENCCYENEKGLKDPIRILIPDLPPKNLAVMNIENFFRDRGFINEEIILMDGIQAIHDGFEPNQWPGKLRWLAHMWNLIIPEIT